MIHKKNNKYILTFESLKQDQFKEYKIIQIKNLNEIPEMVNTFKSEIDVYLFVNMNSLKTQKDLDYIHELCDIYCLKKIII